MIETFESVLLGAFTILLVIIIFRMIQLDPGSRRGGPGPGKRPPQQ